MAIMTIMNIMKTTSPTTSLRPTPASSGAVALLSGLLVAALGLATPVPADACPNKEGACPCGQACPTDHDSAGCAEDKAGDGDECQASAKDKQASPCGCSDAGEQAAPNPDAARPAAAGQRAVLDPETGELVVPEQGDADGAESGEASGARAPAESYEGEARQLAIPGAGVIAPFPVERVSRAVANVDEKGQATGGCEQGIE